MYSKEYPSYAGRKNFKVYLRMRNPTLHNDAGILCASPGVDVPDIRKYYLGELDATVIQETRTQGTKEAVIEDLPKLGYRIQDFHLDVNRNRFNDLWESLQGDSVPNILEQPEYDASTSRTIARYNAGNPYALSPEVAYVIAKARNNGAFADVAQLAYWELIDVRHTTYQPTPESTALVEEARAFARYREEMERFLESNKDYIVDRTDYSECSVGYSLVQNKYVIGPFCIDYVRSFYQSGTNTVNFAGITSVVLFGNTGRLYNYGLIDSSGKSIEYPEPNQNFYISLPYSRNENVDSITGLGFNYEYMNAQGEGCNLNGTYYHLTWEAVTTPVYCENDIACCEHGYTANHEYISCTIHVHNRTCYNDTGELICGKPDHEHDDSCYRTCTKRNYCYRHFKAEVGGFKFHHQKGWLDDFDLVSADGPRDAQKLFNPIWAKITREKGYARLNLKLDLKMHMGGNVFNDLHSGKETDYNGIRDGNERGIKGVKVTIIPQGQSGETRSTYTDDNGNWQIDNVKPGKYDIEFEYDGQTYKATKYLASGDLKNLYDSKASESERERQEFNNKFYEITTNKAIGTNGVTNTLTYNFTPGNSEQKAKSTLITRDSNTNIPYPLFVMKARTSNTGVYYPIDDLFTVGNSDKVMPGGNYIPIYPYMEHINLGLVERAKADFAITKDVYQSHVRLKDEFQDFTYNAKGTTDIENDMPAYITDYLQEINKDDFGWRWDGTLSSIYPNSEESELQVYIDYKIVIRNQSEITKGRIMELVEHYDQELIYESTTPVSNLASWAVIRNENGEELQTQLPLQWNSSSKYGDSKNFEGFTSMYTQGLSGIELQSGELLEVHIIFKVKRDIDNQGNRTVILDGDPHIEDRGKRNVVEINGYQTFSRDGKVEGLIDKDSNPGNSVPSNETTHEDDTNISPYFKMVLDENSSNKIEGNVWEDIRTERLGNNQVIGNGRIDRWTGELNNRVQRLVDNGYLDESILRNLPGVNSQEPNVSGVLVELIEVYTNSTNNQTEQTIKTARTDNNGGYSFTNLPGGIYKVKFTYGDETQLASNLKYNGQDFKSTVVGGNITQKTNKPEAKAEIILTVDVSRSMYTDNRIEKVKTAAKAFVENLFENQSDVKVGLVVFGNRAEKVIEPTKDKSAIINSIDRLSNGYDIGGGTNMASGINLTADSFTGEYNNKIMVFFTDGDDLRPDTAKQALINAHDRRGVYPISILTSRPTEIFGTEDNPTRGETYLISDDDIYTTFTDLVYSNIKDLTFITDGTSYASDNIDRRGAVIGYSDDMTHKEAMVLDIDHIKDELIGEEQREAIGKLATETFMYSITDKMVMRPNNTGQNGQIRQINLGLQERPKVIFKIKEEIEGLQLILSNGTVLVDTITGIGGEYVKPVGPSPSNGYLGIWYIPLDSELQQGARIIVNYKFTITNEGEVDKLSSYYSDINDETIKTAAQTVYDYVNKNMMFVQEEGENENWRIINSTLYESMLSDDVINSIGTQQVTVLSTDKLNKELYPRISTEANAGSDSSTSINLILSKVISPENTEDDLTYNNSVEIVERKNVAGRRDYIGVPGNYEPNTRPIGMDPSTRESIMEEYDSSIAPEIVITKPTGETQIYYIIGGIVLAVLASGIILIKKFVLSKRE